MIYIVSVLPNQVSHKLSNCRYTRCSAVMSDTVTSASIAYSDEDYLTRDGFSLPVRVWTRSDVGHGPCVITFHGGGGTMGQHLEVHPWWIDELVSYGATVISPAYPLAPLGNLSAQLGACADLYAWARGRQSVDENRVIIAGSSWGATLAVLTGAAVSPRPTAVVSLYGVLNFLDPYYADKANFPADPRAALSGDHTKTNILTITAERIEASSDSTNVKNAPVFAPRRAKLSAETLAALHVTDEEALRRSIDIQNDIATVAWETASFLEVVLPRYEWITDERWRRTRAAKSPLSKPNKDSPPHLFVHGDQDTLVPCSNSLDAHDALQLLGVESHLIAVPGGQHGCDKDWKVSVGESVYIHSCLKAC